MPPEGISSAKAHLAPTAKRAGGNSTDSGRSTSWKNDCGRRWAQISTLKIAGLEAAHFGTTFGTVFEKDRKSWSPDYAAIARAYGVDGVKIVSAAEFRPALENAIASRRPVVLDVYMKNEPVPTAGHWNIMDIYSPDRKVHDVATGD